LSSDIGGPPEGQRPRRHAPQIVAVCHDERNL
jgi:hypothetical protein